MQETEIKDIFTLIIKKRIEIVLITLIFFMLGCVYTLNFTKPEYNSDITLVLVSSNNLENTNMAITTSDITLNTKLISTYSKLIKSKNVLKEVISNLELPINEEELENKIEVKRINNTELIDIKVKADTPELANKITNELASIFIQKINEMYNINNIQIMDEATYNEKPYNINHQKDILIFLFAGIGASAIYILILNMLDTTIKKADEIEEEFQKPVLASVPILNSKNIDSELIVHFEPKQPISETFRTLRTNIQFINNKQKIKTILITSTLPREGKSFISANLAIAEAQTGKKVLLIDSDMRKGRQYSIFKLLPKPGLSNYLLDIIEEKQNIQIQKYIQQTEIEKLSIMTAGNIPPNPSELLVSETTLNLIETLKNDFDIIILDGPPTELVTDSIVLTRIVDATIVVAACNETKKDNLHKTIESIKSVGGKITGIAVNKVKIHEKCSYYYGNEEKEK